MRVMSGLKKTTTNWIDSAKYDIESARHMFKTGRYIYVIFLCHLSIEKMLKALVAQSQDRHPPYTHDLYELITLAHLEIPTEHQTVVAQLNEISIATRYPEDFGQMVKHYPKNVAERFLKQSQAFVKWLGHDPRLKDS
jgi:HEPN domain-containing protein